VQKKRLNLEKTKGGKRRGRHKRRGLEKKKDKLGLMIPRDPKAGGVRKISKDPTLEPRNKEKAGRRAGSPQTPPEKKRKTQLDR